MSDFDPDTFLSGLTVEGSLSTTVEAPPEGVYRAQVDSVSARAFTDKNGVDRKIVEVSWDLIDPGLRTRLGRDKITARQTLFLDFDENGALDQSKGKNVALGRLREAVGQNDMKGWKFSDLTGQMATVRVRQEADRNDPEIKYARVERVTAID